MITEQIVELNVYIFTFSAFDHFFDVWYSKAGFVVGTGMVVPIPIEKGGGKEISVAVSASARVINTERSGTMHHLVSNTPNNPATR